MKLTMRLAVLLPLYVSALAQPARLESSRLTTGFLQHPTEQVYSILAPAYRSAIDAEGIHLYRGSRRVGVRFPGAELHWRPEGQVVRNVHVLGPNTRSLRSASSLRVRDAWSGVDIRLLLAGDRLKTEFHLAPGVAVSTVKYCMDTAHPSAIGGGEALRIDAGEGWVWTEENVRAWQTAPSGETLPVDARFAVLDSHCVGFHVDGVDASLPLIIDPEVVFSSYLGGGMFDSVTALRSDAAGNTYVGGWTESTDFPVANAYRGSNAGRIDGFLAKINASGQLVYATYIGGSNEDRVQALAVDAAGNLIAAGLTSSTDFPKQSAAFATHGGARDAFLLKLNSAGNQLVFSTYFGGAGHDSALAVALDPSGNIAVAGETASPNFPLAAPALTCRTGTNGFVSRFSSAGALQFSTCLGGTADDRIKGIATSADGAIHVTGATLSSDFPVVSAYQSARSGAMDAIYAKFSSQGNLLVATYLGGSGGSDLSEESGYGVAIDSSGRAWVAGVTPSTDFPLRSTGHQTVYGGGLSDAFVAIIGGNGVPEWASYIGGSGADAAMAIDASGTTIAIAGTTNSNNLPVVRPTQATRAGEYDAFWGIYNTSGNALTYLSYLGGAGSDSALAVNVSAGILVTGGSTLSGNFIVSGAIQNNNPGGFGGFVSRIRLGPAVASLTPASGYGLSPTFNLSLWHTNSASDIATASLKLEATGPGCQVSYSRSQNTIALYVEESATWLTSALGTGGMIENARCSVTGASVAATSSGSTLNLTIPLSLKSGFGGEKTVSVSAVDSLGTSTGWIAKGTWNASVATAPVLVSLTPSTGSGASATMQVVVSDVNGAADIALVQIAIDTGLGPNGCYVQFQAPGNVNLYRSSDGVWLQSTLSSGAPVEHTNCRVNTATSSVTTSGNTLTFTVSLTFKSPFTGAKEVHVSAGDRGGLTLDWVKAGTWSVDMPDAPRIASLSPNVGVGLNATFTLTASDSSGYADIRTIGLIFNTSVTGLNGCHIQFDRQTRNVSLYRDSDAQWISFVAGTSASIENSNCIVSGTGLSATEAGTQVILAIPITFKAAFSGARNIYTTVSDAGGLAEPWKAAGSWTVTAPSPPAIGSVTPSNGAGSSVVFNAVVSDGNGFGDISTVLFLLNTSVTHVNACYLWYQKLNNTMFLYRDSDGGWLPLVIGSSGTVENSNCVLSSTGLTVTGSGDTLTFRIPLSFKQGFAGTKNFYMYASDYASLASGWTQKATWDTTATPPAPPVVNSVTPNSGSGTSVTFQLNVSDANGASDISAVLLLVNDSITDVNGCYVWYTLASKAYLFRDTDRAWLPVTPGTQESAETAQCKLTGTGVSNTSSGNTLTASIGLTLKAAFTGTKNVYGYALDAANQASGWKQIGTWATASIAYVPKVNSVAPNSGSGRTPLFVLNASDDNGAADLKTVLFLVNDAINDVNACYLWYTIATNKIHLFRDSDRAWLPVTLGTQETAENNACSIVGTGVSMAVSGNGINVSLAITFKQSYSGAKNLYGYAFDTANLVSGWTLLGTWNPSPAAPTPPSITVTPNAGSGGSATFTVTATDANGSSDIASMQFLVNTSVSDVAGCYLWYAPSANRIHLFRDSDRTWLPLQVGSSGTVENAQCILSSSGLTSASSGNSIVLTIPLTFKPGFSGAKTTYAYTYDLGNLQWGWNPTGTWNIP
jgi:hypothetical protein